MRYMRYIDAHNHLQDARFDDRGEELLRESVDHGVVLSAVNGVSPSDWGRVAALSKSSGYVVPFFGVHPWYIDSIPPNWRELLLSYLDALPAGVGEIGIDGWRKEFDPVLQERLFLEQLAIAAERGIPVSIHGLRKWGRLLELLKKNDIPSCGFLLHSFGGPVELVKPFAALGGYFSCPGFFLNKGREMKLSVFRDIPEDRILLETDAPDQNLPEELDRFQLKARGSGTRINHPGTIAAVYEAFAAFRGMSLADLSGIVEANAQRFFAPLLSDRPSGDLSPG